MMIPSDRRFDVVIVPNFTGAGAITFEARTLYFLASWIEHSGVCSEVPLHVASIGEPPPRVRELARRCGAIISVHEPAPADLGVYANKLRGFDAPLQTDRLLLLDVDMLVMSDLSELAQLAPPEAIGATPSHHALLLPEMWEAYYARLGQPAPSHRMADFHLTLDISRNADILPSFNGGVVLAPRHLPLRQLWEQHLRVLNEFREAWSPTLRSLNKLWGDEPAITTSIQQLQREGHPVIELPDRFNGRWRHLYRRSPRMREFRLFHMTSSFGHGETLSQKMDPVTFAYERKLIRRYGKRWLQHSKSHAREALTYLVPASVEVVALTARLRKLYDKHLKPMMETHAD